MVMQRTPASTNRRAIKHDCPNECRPYSSRSGIGSWLMSNAAFVAEDVIRSNALAWKVFRAWALLLAWIAAEFW